MKWKKKKLCECTEYITDGDHQPAPKADKGVHFIKIKDIVNNQVSFDAQVYVPQEYYDNLPMERKPQKEDVLYTVVGSFGIPSYVQTDELFCFERNIALLHPNKDIEPRFLYYSLKNPAFYKGVEIVANGSAQKLIPLSKLKDLKISVPDKEAQRHIADILSAYDDLIENNQKQIKLLEEAAQRLYKEWFVDLRFPGHENTKIVDGVPEGWQYEKLGDLVKTTSGGTPSRRKSEYYVNGNIRWIKTKELNDRFIFETEEHITEDAVKNSSAKVLPEGALIVAMYGATIGKIGITAAEMACNQACCAFISFDDMISKEYLYCWLMDNREYLVSQGKGAAQSNLSQEMIRNFSLLCPDKKVIKNFTEIVTTMLENKRVLENKILMLSKARDDLLPKLMSGEVEV